MMGDLVDVGYNENEIKDGFDAISPDPEVPMVHPLVQQPDVLGTQQQRGQ